MSEDTGWIAEYARRGATARGDDAASAGKAAAHHLSTAERGILAAMASAGTLAIRGAISPQLARRKVSMATAVELGRASAALRDVYGCAVRDVTGKDGPLPDAPDQVARAILRAQQDANVAFGGVLAAALGPGNGVRMPTPSSPYRRIVTSAARQGTPGKAAAAALAAIGERGLTGYVTPSGRRQPLAAYGQRAVRTSVARLARMPVMGEITARRDQLLSAHAAAVTAAWNDAAARLSPATVVRAYQGDSRLSGAAGDPAVAKRWQQEAASAASAAWLAGITGSPGYAGFTSALAVMAADGMAEGQADALAMAAYQQKVAGFSIAAAFAAAQAQYGGGMDAARQAQGAAAGIIAGAARDVARALVSATRDGDGEAEDDAEGALKGAASRGADWALWAAFGAGAMALYRRLAASQFTGGGLLIDWNTDSSPCAMCAENAAAGPYTPDQVPPYPGHRACRCWLSADAEVPVSMLASLLA